MLFQSTIMKLNKSIYISLVLIFSVFAISSCSDSSTNSTNNSGNGLPTGNLLGKIGGLMDSMGVWQTDLSGVTVEAVGSGITAQSDSKGYWELKNLSTRTYDLKFSKPEYMDYYQIGYSFLGGATSQNNQQCILVMPPHFTMIFDGMTVAINGKGMLAGSLFTHCTGSVPTFGPVNIAIWAVFGATPNIDLNDNSTFIARISNSSGVLTDAPSSSLMYSSWAINDTAHFHSGQTVFCRLYPFIYTTNYFNLDTRQTIYQGQAAGSNVLSQILP
jgi:hypothetical protein